MHGVQEAECPCFKLSDTAERCRSTGCLQQRWGHFQVSRLGKLKYNLLKTLQELLFYFASIPVPVNSLEIMGRGSRQERHVPAGAFILQLRKLPWRTVTQGHTAAQLNSPILLSRLLLLSSAPYTLLSSCDRMIFVWYYCGFLFLFFF